jgi:adenosylmethionine-8-amino-7-oxononanoate aminotransferase
MQGPPGAIELFHGYTYSGHPAASAALIATLGIYRRERLFERARELEPYWQDAIHSLRQAPNVIDVRDIGLVEILSEKSYREHDITPFAHVSGTTVTYPPAKVPLV